jgi:hypothetical protein
MDISLPAKPEPDGSKCGAAGGSRGAAAGALSGLAR